MAGAPTIGFGTPAAAATATAFTKSLRVTRLLFPIVCPPPRPEANNDATGQTVISTFREETRSDSHHNLLTRKDGPREEERFAVESLSMVFSSGPPGVSSRMLQHLADGTRWKVRNRIVPVG